MECYVLVLQLPVNIDCYVLNYIYLWTWGEYCLLILQIHVNMNEPLGVHFTNICKHNGVLRVNFTDTCEHMEWHMLILQLLVKRNGVLRVHFYKYMWTWMECCILIFTNSFEHEWSVACYFYKYLWTWMESCTLILQIRVKMMECCVLILQIPVNMNGVLIL